MTIHIPVSSLDVNIKKLYLEEKLKGFGIDYQPNCLMAWYGEEEVEVFNFNKICKLDNRYTSYNLFTNKTEIILEIVGYKD
jgi:hypothetical protein